jgi:hypothetical protein
MAFAAVMVARHGWSEPSAVGHCSMKPTYQWW